MSKKLKSTAEELKKLESLGDSILLEGDRMDDAETSGKSAHQKNVREEMANMPLAELMALREKLGSKLCDRTLFHKSQDTEFHQKIFRKENKKRPREMSSKVPVSVYRDVFNTSKKQRIDPRYDEKCGPMNEMIFRKDYKFIDELKQMERKDMKKHLKEETDEEKKEQIKLAIQRMDNQKRAIEETEEKKKHLRELRKQNVERLKQGKAPVFVPRAELKKAELVDKFLTLKDSGKMDKFMKKKLKSKKNKQEIPT